MTFRISDFTPKEILEIKIYYKITIKMRNFSNIPSLCVILSSSDLFLKYTRCPKKASHFCKRITQEIFRTEIQFRSFAKATACRYLVRQKYFEIELCCWEGASTENGILNQLQKLSVIKCMEASEVTLAAHLGHLFITA